MYNNNNDTMAPRVPAHNAVNVYMLQTDSSDRLHYYYYYYS